MEIGRGDKDPYGDIFLNSDSMEDQKILAVDDDQAIIFLLREFLEGLKVEVYTAADGLEALEVLKEKEISIVITDLLMPRLGGIDLTKKIKEEWPDTDVLVMTGYGKEFSYTDVIRAGASDFIQKPFHLNELEAKLNRIVRERAMRHQLKMLSVKDPLTSLYNRRFFEQRIEEEIERARRQGYPLYFFMVDLDNFKELNDSQGHQKGDEVLKLLAKVLTSSTRRFVDTVFRYGGDEFVVIVPQATYEQALSIAERIRSNYFAREERRGTTLSIGIACFSCDQGGAIREDIHQLIRNADDAMYEAKKKGGNQIFPHPSVESCRLLNGKGECYPAGEAC